MKLVISSIIFSVLLSMCFISYSQENELIPSVRSANDRFGSAVAMEGDRAIVGASGAERAFIFKRCGRTWIETEMFEIEGNPPEVSWDASFGRSVDISDNYAIVGDPDRYVSPYLSPLLGSAFIFKRNEEHWEYVTQIVPPEPLINHVGDKFGTTVAITDSFAVVGEPLSHSAHIYKRNGENWDFQMTLSNGYFFGQAVDITDHFVAVGTAGGGMFNPAQGSVHIYQNNGGNWIHQAQIQASDGSDDDGFGESVSLSDSSLIAGDRKAKNSEGVTTGAAYVYHFDNNEWMEFQKLTPTSGAAGSLFGTSVAIFENDAIVGAPGEQHNGIGTGAVYIFSKESVTWEEEARILPVKEGYDFGRSVSISGNAALAGSMSGFAYSYSFGPLETFDAKLKLDSFEMSQPVAGDSIDLHWWVENIDTLAIENQACIEVVYISPDTVWDINDMVLYADTLLFELQPSASMPRSVSIIMPGIQENEPYYLMIRSFPFCANSELLFPYVTDAFHVEYNELAIPESTPDTITGNQEIYYKIQVPESLVGQTLNIYLEDDTDELGIVMYSSLDTIPDEFEYDLISEYSEGKKKLIIPGLQRGTYYLLIHGNTDLNNEPIEIVTEIPPFEILTLNPMQGGNTGFVTLKIIGSQLDTMMDVSLVNDLAEIRSYVYHFKDPTTCFARFDLSGVQQGEYDLVIEKENGAQTMVTDGFEVVQGVPPEIITDLLSTSVTRVDFTETITFTCKNDGNTDITEYVARFESAGESPISFTIEGLDENLKELRLLLQHPDSPYGIIRPGEEFSIPVYTHIEDSNFKLILSIIK